MPLRLLPCSGMPVYRYNGGTVISYRKFLKITSNPRFTLRSALCTYVTLRTVLLSLQRF